jgi:hypothetical protein
LQWVIRRSRHAGQRRYLRNGSPDRMSAITKTQSCCRHVELEPRGHHLQSQRRSTSLSRLCSLVLWWFSDFDSSTLPPRAQRPIESAHSVHILAILRLLLLPHPIYLISRHFGILRRLEPREPHQLPQRRIFCVLAWGVDFHLRGRGGLFVRGSCFGWGRGFRLGH